MNNSVNQLSTLKALPISTHGKRQSGFILLAVLVILLLISGLTALMMSQNSVDVRSVLYHQNQSKLLITADQATMNLWQLPPERLVQMAQAETWLASLLSTNNDFTKIYTAQSCDNWQTFTIGTLDDPPLQCHHTAPLLLWQAAYIEPIGKDHYLHRLSQNTPPQQSTSDLQDSDHESTDQKAADHEILHLRLYAIAAQNSEGIAQCEELLYQAHIAACLSEHGVIHKISVAEWLIERQTTSKTDPASETVTTFTITPLRIYDIRSMRE
ncbi:hypothetical protein [Moraxella canis]|uniref:Uncharacterized protein n=1 Tax=Moraxella canis TaxID=90239 RepID=A0A1S9ZM12_9GAMM|nr:hypothetical protein [Moraxella canis]OOR84486.1 hypothetical protein B0180_02700 [Moraxella canis]